MCTIPEFQRWLNTLNPAHHIAIDEGGLTAIEVAPDGQPTGAYYEIGGGPCEDDETD